MENELKIKLSYQVMVISGIFCLLVAMLLILNFWHMKKNDPLESATIEVLIQRLKDDPNDDELKEEIRSFDLLARKAYFTGQWQVKTGAYLLLFGGIVFAIALKINTDLRAKINVPEDDNNLLIRSRLLTQRWILAGGGVVLVLALLAAWFSNDYLRDFEPGNLAITSTEPAEGGVGQVEIIEIRSDTTQSRADSVMLSAEKSKSEIKEEGVAVQSSEPPFYGFEDFRKNQNTFRGLFGQGVDYHRNIPVDWDGSSGKNVRWKVAITKSGYNSPVIWENKIFVAGADAKSRIVYCFDRQTGQLIWERVADNIKGSPATPPRVSDDTGLSAPTMAVDGHRVYAIFATGDVIAFDLNGNRIWARNLGIPVNHYGHSSSLMVWREKLIIQYDTGKGGRMLSLNTGTGETIWDIKRDNQISWSSPILIRTVNSIQIVTSADPYVAGYELDTGKELWKVDAMMGEVGPSPAYDEGLVYAANEYARLVAIKPEPGTDYVWENDEYLPEASSPVASGGLLYLATSYGVLVCYDDKTGEKQWEKEYRDGFYASPMVSDGKVYAIDMGGNMHILKADRSGTEIGSPALGEEAFASPAFADNFIYLRGIDHLYCIGE